MTIQKLNNISNKLKLTGFKIRKARLMTDDNIPTHIKNIIPEVMADIKKRALISALERIILAIGDEKLSREARLNDVLLIARNAIKAARGES